MASSAPRCAGGLGRDRVQLDGEEAAGELSSDTDPHHPMIENSLCSDGHAIMLSISARSLPAQEAAVQCIYKGQPFASFTPKFFTVMYDFTAFSSPCDITF